MCVLLYNFVRVFCRSLVRLKMDGSFGGRERYENFPKEEDRNDETENTRRNAHVSVSLKICPCLRYTSRSLAVG